MDTLETLSNDISKKRLFIYEINFDSVIAFSTLFFRKIKIEAFVCVHSEYEGESFLNVPVIGKREAEMKADNAILLIPDEFNVDKIQIKMECCSFSRIWTLNERLREGTENYLYGAGNRGRELYLELESRGVKTGGFCVSEKPVDLCSFMGKKVVLPDQITDKKASIIIAVYDEKIRKEMIRNCQEIGLENIFIDEFIQKPVLKFNLFLQYLDIAVRQKKKILIYSDQKDTETALIEECLQIYGISVDGYVSDGGGQNGISDVYELVYEADNCFLIINERETIKTNKICNLLDEIGFSLEKHSYVGLQKVTVNYIDEKPKILDPLMGHSVKFEGYTGIRMYGEADGAHTRILILGGSTSTDGIFRPMAWTEYLWKKIKKKRKNIVIYNMAHCGDDAIKEFLRLIRDGWYMKPDLVISMSGFNNTYYDTASGRGGIEHLEEWAERLYPGMETFSGIEKKESLFKLWVRMQKLIEAATLSIGAKYLCYLQPIKMMKSGKTFSEHYCFDSELRNREKSFVEESESGEFYKNLMTLFDDEDGMYIDTGHYSDKANRILADIVYKDVDRVLEEEISRGCNMDR